MDTVIKKIMHDDSDDEIYEQAAEILKNGGIVVEILINHKSSEPIYEQIDTQIKQMIL